MGISEHSLYLHFLDRELCYSVKKELSPDLTESIIKHILIFTVSPLYCGLSLAWESTGIHKFTREIIKELVERDILDLISNYPTVDEFIASRQSIYEHDHLRYPMYFTNELFKYENFQPKSYKPNKTTQDMSRSMSFWVADDKMFIDEVLDSEVVKVVKSKLYSILLSRKNEAITYSIFQDSISSIKNGFLIENLVRRKISSLYTSHYQEYGNADILTGIQGLNYYDVLSINYPFYDVSIISSYLHFLNQGKVLSQPWKYNQDFWSSVIENRNCNEHILFRQSYRCLLDICYVLAIDHLSKINNKVSQFNIKNTIIALLSEYLPKRKFNFKPNSNIKNYYNELLIYTNSYINNIINNHKSNVLLEEVLMKYKYNSCDVLVVVVNEIERDAIISTISSNYSRSINHVHSKDKTYFDLGEISGAKVFMVQSEMGSIQPGASMETIINAIDLLNPSSIIMSGVAFGVDPEDQSIGEIIVSRQLQNYEVVKIGEGVDSELIIKPRGDKVTASTMLLSRFRSSLTKWKGAKVEFGLLLSGEKLIDNYDFREQLKTQYVEALGGEMEGAGLYAAARSRSKEWIIVKSICDWADGNKKKDKVKRQKLASNNSARFVIHTLELGGFCRDELI